MNNMKKSSWQVLIVILVLSIGVWVFNYTSAQRNDEPSNNSSLLHDNYRGLFDKDSTPKNYLENGNFYSQEKPHTLIIDTSFINKVDTAIWWYDKVLNEFPGTEEANEALKQKIRTLIGWEEGYGRDKETYALRDRANGNRYFPLLESTFFELETGFPDDEYLEAFAFQIAQRYFIFVLGYRKYEYTEDCLRWFEKTIELAKGKDTFYSHLARNRISSVKGLKN